MARHLLLPLLYLAVLVVTTAVDFRANLNHPYAGTSLSRDDVIGHATRASKARAVRINARIVARATGKGDGLSSADVPAITPLGDQGHTVTLGIGTPLQPSTLIVDTGSDLIWTQCALFFRRRVVRQRDLLYDPRRSSSFTFLPCSSMLCKEGQFSDKKCTWNRCLYDDVYGSAEAGGILASEAFTFGARGKVSLPLGFGCGVLSSGTLVSASSLMGLSPGTITT